jgi:hypothetical protein
MTNMSLYSYFSIFRHPCGTSGELYAFKKRKELKIPRSLYQRASSGMISIVNGLSNMRNVMSDAHATSTWIQKKISMYWTGKTPESRNSTVKVIF